MIVFKTIVAELTTELWDTVRYNNQTKYWEYCDEHGAWIREERPAHVVDCLTELIAAYEKDLKSTCRENGFLDELHRIGVNIALDLCADLEHRVAIIDAVKQILQKRVSSDDALVH